MAAMFRRKIQKSKSFNGCEDIHFSCTVRFLDEKEALTISFQKDTSGQYIIDHVCNSLDLVEKDYFGLRYVDANKQRHWLEPSQPAYKQLKGVQPMALCFRVKFYPSDPLKLKEEITRYYLYLQLRRDVHHGRLLCGIDDACLLTAHVAQGELGDHENLESQDYVSKLKMLPKQSLLNEEKVAEFHKSLANLTPVEAEAGYLKIASKLDTYGVDPHPVRDDSAAQMYLGVTHLGVITFKGNKRTHLFKWQQVSRLGFEGKHFIVNTNCPEDQTEAPLSSDVSTNTKRKTYTYTFKCPSTNACKHLWKCAIQQQCFYNLQSAKEATAVRSRTGLLRRGSTYKYSGRCEFEACKDSEQISREPPAFKRSASNPQIVRAFSNLHSNTLPLDFKLSEGSEDLESSSRPRSLNLDDFSNRLETSFLNASIPEESAVEIADTSYSPCISLDVPSIEVITDENGLVDETPTDNHHGVDDLTSQTESELRHRITSTPLDRDSSEIDAVETTELDLVKTQLLPLLDAEDTIHQANGVKHEYSTSRKKLLIFVVVWLLVILLSFVFVLEVGAKTPFVSAVRQFAPVRYIRRHYYLPLRKMVTRALW